MKTLIGLLTLAALPVHSQTVAQLAAEVAALTKTVSAQSSTISSLQTTVVSLQKAETSQNTTQTNSTAALQRQVNLIAGNRVLALGPFVSVNLAPPNGIFGPLVTFSGVNVEINNGAGSTQATNGLGNLFIGYMEAYSAESQSANSRAGSHNIVLGRSHAFPFLSWANLIVGESNFAEGNAGVVAGYQNTVGAQWASVLGGNQNASVAPAATVVGGQGGEVTSPYATVLGQAEPSTATGQIVTLNPIPAP
jgi:hypothetical protein